MEEDRIEQYQQAFQELTDDNLLDILSKKLNHYNDGYLRIKTLTDKCAILREEIQLIEIEMKKRFVEQEKEHLEIIE